MPRSLRRARVLLVTLGAAAAPLAGAPVRDPVAAVRVEVASRQVPHPVPTLVFLPPSYAVEKERRYPVLYFLHDGQGSETTLLDRGAAERLRDAMRAGTLPEAIVVAPRGVGTWYVDSFDGRTRYAHFLHEELVPYVDGKFRTRAERAARAAMGISMGGYGALHWAFTHPEDLAAVGALSPAVQQLDWRGVLTMPFFLRPMITDVFGKGPGPRRNVLRRNDLYDILLSNPAAAARAPEVFVRCGAEDRYRLGEVSVFFGKFLTAMGVRNEVVVEPGRHEWSYWGRAFAPVARALLSRIAP